MEIESELDVPDFEDNLIEKLEEALHDLTGTIFDLFFLILNLLFRSNRDKEPASYCIKAALRF
jgi:hypothetical protein